MTDADRFAGVIDKRFRGIAFKIRAGRQDAVSAVCDYLDLRDKEAERVTEVKQAPIYQLAHRLSMREVPRLFQQGDPLVSSLEQQCRGSNPTMRMLAAFYDSCEGAPPFDSAYAARRFRWLCGAVEAEDEFSDLRHALRRLEGDVAKELTARQREAFLGMKRAHPVEKMFTGDVLSEAIEVPDL